jgi:4'-phosphopantetheinyl transferase
MALNVRFERVSDKLDLELSAEVVHLWSISLSTSAEGTRILRRLLSSGECEEADRFHFEADRQRFIAARAVLRSLLASYTNRRAEELTFHYNSSGKPRLVGGGKHVEFNLAHSEAQALYGFRVDHSIGVDIEVIQPYDDFLTMADKYFAREEYVSVTSSPEQERNELFLQYWTLK